MSVDRMHSFVDTVKVPHFQSLKNIIRNFHFYFPSLVYGAGDDTVEAGRVERDQTEDPGCVSLQGLDQLTGGRAPDVEVSPQPSHGQALVPGEEAGAGPLGCQEDVLGAPRQQQHLLYLPAGRD